MLPPFAAVVLRMGCSQGKPKTRHGLILQVFWLVDGASVVRVDVDRLSVAIPGAADRPLI
jgi:hypothetical protein